MTHAATLGNLTPIFPDRRPDGDIGHPRDDFKRVWVVAPSLFLLVLAFA